MTEAKLRTEVQFDIQLIYLSNGGHHEKEVTHLFGKFFDEQHAV